MNERSSLNITSLLGGLHDLLKYESLEEAAKSKAQQRLMGMVHAAQKGGKPSSKKVADIAKSMGKKDVTDFAKTKHKGLPAKVEQAECDVMTDEELAMFSRKGDTTGRHSISRLRKEDSDVDECAGVGIITKQNSTVDVNSKTPQKNLDAFNLEEAMIDMYDAVLKEGGIKKLSKTATSSIKGAITTPAANNNAGDSYKSYRFGLALAGAPEFPTKAVNDIGGDPLLTTYTDEEWEMVKYAGKQADVGPLKRLSSNRSVELDDTNKLSAVAKIKKNKYGV
jgi:hypothetical protein